MNPKRNGIIILLMIADCVISKTVGDEIINNTIMRTDMADPPTGFGKFFLLFFNFLIPYYFLNV